ncbi:MAG: hypothetical protein HY926_00045 [Elusimicrobia bacterium]|nr:hypothetical protein [Elusimicrobiota bacterium]
MTLPWAALLLAGSGWGTEVKLSVPSTSAVLGEPVTVQAAAALEPGAALALDLQASATETFAITGARELESPAGSAERRFELQLIPLDLGPRAFPILWTLAAGGSTRTLSSTLRLEVREPPGAEKAQDIKDIKPPRAARPRLWPFLLMLLLAGAAWYWGTWRKKRPAAAGAAAGPPPDPRPAEVIAESELERLAASRLWEEGRRKEFYGELTDILRRYLERRWAFPATRETTAEIARRLRGRDLDRRLLALFKELFERADLVKFSKTATDDRWKEADLAAARRLVHDTTPKPAELAAGGPS